VAQSYRRLFVRHVPISLEIGRSEPTAEHPPLAANAQAVAGAVIRSFTAAVEPYECLYLVV
jgi:hypothetical protein